MFDSLIARYLKSPEHPAKLRIVHALARAFVPERGLRARVAPDLQLYLHPRDWIEYLLLRGEPYEPLTLAFMRSNLRPGDTAVLAGTNFGLHVARAARSVGDAGLVIAVEPQPQALLRTRLNLELNGLLGNVRLVEAALGRHAAMAAMAWSRPDNPGAASLLDKGPGFSVQVLPLSTLLAAFGRERFRLLLLDVQGYELQVLRGADLAHGPELAVVELDPEFLNRSGVGADEIAATLHAFGYELFDLHGTSPSSFADLPERNLVAVQKGVAAHWPAGPR